MPTELGIPMIRLLYMSHAATTVSDKDVQDILACARQRNPANGITGVLLHGGGLFMQVLEGPEPGVLRQYVKIMDDQRHSDARIIHFSPANTRIFENWSMGSIDGDPLQFQHIVDMRARRTETIHAREFTNTMRDFAKRLKAAK